MVDVHVRLEGVTPLLHPGVVHRVWPHSAIILLVQDPRQRPGRVPVSVSGAALAFLTWLLPKLRVGESTQESSKQLFNIPKAVSKTVGCPAVRETSRKVKARDIAGHCGTRTCGSSSDTCHSPATVAVRPDQRTRSGRAATPAHAPPGPGCGAGMRRRVGLMDFNDAGHREVVA